MRRRTYVIGVATISSSLAGCPSPAITEELEWKLRVIDVEEQPDDGSGMIEVTVGINGNYDDDALVESVRVCFLDDQHELIGTSSVGRISADRPSRTISAAVSRKPTLIALDHGRVEGDGEFSVQGLRREDSDTYTVFTQMEDYC